MSPPLIRRRILILSGLTNDLGVRRRIDPAPIDHGQIQLTPETLIGRYRLLGHNALRTIHAADVRLITERIS